MPSGRKPRPRVIPIPPPDDAETLDAPPPEVAANPDAAAAWGYVVDATKKVGTYNPTDRATYVRYALLAGQWLAAARVVERDGAITVTKTGYTCANGAFVVMSKLERMLSAAETRVGLNPSGRESLHADKQSAEVDPLNDFLRKA